MSGWTHNMCRTCWELANPERLCFATHPNVMDTCCWCGRENTDGIIVRHNPMLMTCEHPAKEGA